MAEKDKDKKKFISEKIVGRPLTLKRAWRYALLSVVCGFLFGGAAYIAATLPGDFGGGDNNAGADIPAYEEKDGASFEAEATGSGEESKQEPSEAETEPIEDIVRSEVEKHRYNESDFSSIISNVRKLSEEIGRSIVTVRSVSSDRGWFNDPVATVDDFSGIIIGIEDGNIDILTTESAVINADSLEIMFSNGAKANAEFVQASHYDNIALVRLSESELSAEELSGIEAVKWGSASSVKPGDFVIAAGAPIGISASYDYGFVNFIYDDAPSPDTELKKLYAKIKADTSMGTYIMDDEGKFIGFAGGRGTEDNEEITEIVSASEYKSLIDKLAEGSVIPFIGIEGQEVTAEMRENGMPTGVYVTRVIADSPAYAAGIKRGDIIVSIDDKTCGDISEFWSILSKLPYESTVKLVAARTGAAGEYQEMEYSMVVGAR